MDSTERGVDPASFLASYALAASSGLRRTAHQGENSGADAIEAAIDVLGCERIDHGISVMEDPNLVRRLVDARIPLTVCPQANVRINPDLCVNLADHVFPRLREAGLIATLNTDDPALTDLDLAGEYAAASATFGYGVDDLMLIALDGVTASWATDDEKRSMHERILASSPM
jgi:adenosine deaminase